MGEYEGGVDGMRTDAEEVSLSASFGSEAWLRTVSHHTPRIPSSPHPLSPSFPRWSGLLALLAHS